MPDTATLQLDFEGLCAWQSWRRLDGQNQSPKVILGLKFTDEIEVVSRKLKLLPPDPSRHRRSSEKLDDHQPRCPSSAQYADRRCL
jgi:hypothetical protein